MSQSDSLGWRVIERLADEAHRRVAGPLGALVDRLDRMLVRLYWRSREKGRNDGIPF